MAEVFVKLPDNKLSFFLELIEQLSFINAEENIIITEEDKKVVRKRLKDFDRSKMIPWNDAKKSFKVK